MSKQYYAKKKWPETQKFMSDRDFQPKVIVRSAISLVCIYRARCRSPDLLLPNEIERMKFRPRDTAISADFNKLSVFILCQSGRLSQLTFLGITILNMKIYKLENVTG